MSTHHLPPEALHRAWDRDLPPALIIDPGDTVIFSTIDAADGSIPPPDWAAPNPPSSEYGVRPTTVGAGHPICGPIAVRGALPGDTLAIEVLDIATESWGWTAIGDKGVLGTSFPSAPWSTGICGAMWRCPGHPRASRRWPCACRCARSAA